MIRIGGVLMLIALVGLAGGCAEDPARKVQSADQATRLKGLDELAAENSERSFAAAVEAISHDDVMTARAAVRAIGRMPHRGAAPVLARVVATDRRPEVREEAALALSYCPVPEASQTLREVVRKDSAPQVRAAAAIGLGRVGSLADVEFLLNVGDSDPDRMVQYQAVGALERILGIGFTFEPNLPEDRRRLTMEKVRESALIRAADLRNRSRTQRAKGAPS